ncbi:TetR/AcrR family transcriptional regulator [Paenibacillus sp. OAS669]|uniref:TetR/AcrR family transcriptional regulator n=1 Tax=Paenibacillus sp. OAS669 TaxID=2663821 RepID=UPI001A0B05A5|nr:TetR/AcrR family transcriptional regulator [Paenibacillus sp. OAS669]MBE1442417.1 AcrR family transcriptional regulator [Paenibacillus sp. OAS669]
MEATLSKRDKIMEAALVLFAERGYDGTTVPMIADKAEVGTGTIYRYFENKEALVNALFQDCVQGLHDTVKRDYPEAGGVREQFRHVFFAMVRFAKANIHGFYFVDTHSNARYLDPESRESFRQLMDFLHAYAAAGIQQGIIRPSQANVLIAIVFGAFAKVFSLIRAGKLTETPQMLGQLEESCWDAVSVHGKNV